MSRRTKSPWRSFHQEAYENRVGAHGVLERQHLFHTTAAYTACLYAHRTAALVTDDRARAGELKKYKAVVVSFEGPPPPDLAARLKEFQDAGGLVLANKPSDGYWRPPGAIELGPAFRSHADFLANNDSARHIGLEEDGRKGAAVLLEALGDKVKPLADCDDPTTWLSVLEHGKARYVCAVNVKRLPQEPMDLHRYSGYENTRMPTRTKVRLLPGDFVVSDVFAGKPVSPVKKGGAWEVEADLSVFPGAIFALLPAPIDRLRLSAGQAADGTRLRVRVEVADARGKTIDAAVPLEVTIQDALEGRRYQLYRTAVHGVWDETLPVAANDAPGRWKLRAVERLSGRQVSGEVDVKVPALPQARPTPPVEWTRAERVVEALRLAKRVGVVVEDKQAEPLAAAVKVVEEWLTGRGKEVKRVGAKDYLADRQKYQWDRFRFGGMKTADIQLRPARYDLIVTFDTPALPGGIVPSDLLPIAWTAADPGPGRGLVQHAVMPVYDTEDAIVLAGGDPAGLLAAATSLASPPEPAPVERPAAVPLTPIGAAKTVAMPGLREFLAVTVARDGLRYAVGEVDGTLRLMKGGGQVAGWVSPDGSVVSLSLNRQGDRVAFATTGGWAGVMDFTGRVSWQRHLGARAVIGFLGDKGDTVVGDWRGLVRRLDSTGKLVWEVDLTPQVWREDTAALLTKPDSTPTLRLPPPARPRTLVPEGRPNLAAEATVKLHRPKAWMGDDYTPIREVRLDDGKKDPPPGGWFARPTLELAAFVPSPPCWELSWKEPVTLNTVAVYESADHPEAVPEEIKIEAWVHGRWEVVRHEFWNRGVVHAHRFSPVTTTRLRYMPVGDLARNVWLSEIEVFNVSR